MLSLELTAMAVNGLGTSPLTLALQVSTESVPEYDVIVMMSLGCRVGGDVSSFIPNAKVELVVIVSTLDTVTE